MTTWNAGILLALALPMAIPQPPTEASPKAEARIATVGAAIRQLSLDPDACFRIRDLEFRRDDARFYLNDGWLIFARPVEGRRIAAVFVTGETGDDAELTLRPPDLSERLSLAKNTGSPNLNEHFASAVFVFTDGAGEELFSQSSQAPSRRDAEMGLVLTGRHESLVRNLVSSFQVRLVLDLLTQNPRNGLFFAALAGKMLGNFDVLFDPTMQEQLVVGKVGSEQGSPDFQIWTSFQTRASRQRGEQPNPELQALSYRIDATIEKDLRLRAVTTARLKVLRPVQGALAFEIAPAMEVQSAKWNGVPVEVFRRDSLRDGLMRGSRNDAFLIGVPQPQPAGAEVEIEFTHSGNVILPAGNDVYYVAARMNWYPSRRLEFSHYDLTFRVPAGLDFVATGDVVEERVQDEWRIVHRKTTVPVRVVGFNVGTYERVSSSRGDYVVEVNANRKAEAALQRRQAPVLIVPAPGPMRSGTRRPSDVISLPPVAPNPTARLREIATSVMNDVDWMQTQFGPLPLKRLTVAPIPGFFGQGFPGLIYLATISYLSPSERPASETSLMQETFYSDLLASHELAHQWWGNLVTSATYRDDWIQEALANYSALLVLEKRKGSRVLQAVLENYRDGLRRKLADGDSLESTGPIVWGVRLHTKSGADPWRAIVYDKGSWILHMLRRRMGDEAFMRMLGELRKRYEYKALTTEDLRATAVEFSPKGLPDPDLENFFDNWIYSTGIPTLSVTSSVKGKAPVQQLQVTVRQSDVPEDFSIDVPVEVRVPGEAKPRVKWVRTSNEPATFTLPLKRGPAKVELAPGESVLAVIR